MDARLEPYRTLVSFLGEALGPDYEVVLHDLTSEEGTIAAIVNNNISGRTEGAPLSNMALRFIHGKVYEKQPYVAGYQGASQAKGRLRRFYRGEKRRRTGPAGGGTGCDQAPGPGPVPG